MQKIYLIIGVPGSGKSWVSSKLEDRFEVLPHDEFLNANYPAMLVKAACMLSKPIVGELPFGITETLTYLQESGADVEPVFIVEPPDVLKARYSAREGKDIPKGHLTRQNTYYERSIEYGAFSGTAQKVLDYLKKKV
jgi:hypothetical protein